MRKISSSANHRVTCPESSCAEARSRPNGFSMISRTQPFSRARRSPISRTTTGTPAVAPRGSASGSRRCRVCDRARRARHRPCPRRRRPRSRWRRSARRRRASSKTLVWNGSRACAFTAWRIAETNWRVDCSERATPTTPKRSGSSRRTASAYSAGKSLRLVRSPDAPKIARAQASGRLRIPSPSRSGFCCSLKGGGSSAWLRGRRGARANESANFCTPSASRVSTTTS